MDFSRFLKQKATYWANPVNDGFNGMSFDEPIELDVRWEEKKERFTNDKAEELISRAVVYLNQDVYVGEMIALIDLANLSSSEMPNDNEAYEIRAVGKMPNVKGDSFLRKVWL